MVELLVDIKDNLISTVTVDINNIGNAKFISVLKSSICSTTVVYISDMDRREILMPAESGEYIANHAEHVKIHEEGLDKVCEVVSTYIPQLLIRNLIILFLWIFFPTEY